MNTSENKERQFTGLVVNGFAMLALILVGLPAIAAAAFLLLPMSLLGLSIAIAAVAFIGMIILSCGLMVLQPNQSRVMIFFGKYCGTFRQTGYYWVNPFMTKRKVSLRIRNMDVAPIKVNDKAGNPVMIGMVLVWKVCDTYRAVFDVDSADEPMVKLDQSGKEAIEISGDSVAKALNAFVGVQSDAALREVTGHYAYDQTGSDANELTLRDGGEEINELLERKINERLAIAGMEVVEARLNYLAYAPEIAAVMLRRQQASAIISAREKIVEGAVSMVKMAIDRIETDKVATFDEARKATLVGNLLVVLCSDEPAQPVLNTDA